MFYQQALINLLANKLRSLLALLGMLIGTSSVVALLLCGNLAAQETIKQYQKLGTDLLAVAIAKSKTNLSLQDAKKIISADHRILLAAPYSQNYAQIRYRNVSMGAPFIGVNQYFADIAHIEMAQGRFVSCCDTQEFFCVLGNHIAEEIKKKSLINLLGQQIQIGNNIFTIVGIMKPRPENNFININLGSAVLVPIMAAAAVDRFAVINNFLFRLSQPNDSESIKENISCYIDHFAPENHLFFRSAKELIAGMKKQSEILTVLLALIGGISLLVGGIGIMNIMLASVIERRKEMGVRLAVGATRQDICLLFLLEALLLTVIGGSLGVIIGILFAYGAALIWHWSFIFFVQPLLVGFFISVATGIFFGFYPAYKASQLNIDDMLRVNLI